VARVTRAYRVHVHVRAQAQVAQGDADARACALQLPTARYTYTRRHAPNKAKEKSSQRKQQMHAASRDELYGRSTQKSIKLWKMQFTLHMDTYSVTGLCNSHDTRNRMANTWGVVLNVLRCFSETGGCDQALRPAASFKQHVIARLEPLQSPALKWRLPVP
jgi:hypothetical protein